MNSFKRPRRKRRSRECQRVYSTAAAVGRRTRADINRVSERDRGRINGSGHRERRQELTVLGVIGIHGERL